MNPTDGPGAFFLNRKLRYRDGGFDAIDKYIFQANLVDGFHVQFQGAGLNGNMSFSASAIESGVGSVAMSQGNVYSSSSDNIDIESTQITEDSPPFLISRKLFSELKTRGKTVLQYGDPIEISVKERLNEKILVDGSSKTVPAYRCVGELDFQGETGNFETVIVNDPNWPIVLRIECGPVDSDFRLFTRFEEAGRDLQLEASDD